MADDDDALPEHKSKCMTQTSRSAHFGRQSFHFLPVSVSFSEVKVSFLMCVGVCLHMCMMILFFI